MSIAIIPACLGDFRIGPFCLHRIGQKLRSELARRLEYARPGGGSRPAVSHVLHLDEDLLCRVTLEDQCPLFSSAPRFHKSLHELRVARKPVLRLSLRAANQCRILLAFEEQCWPPLIADPLDEVADIDPTKRLHDTIFSLNRRQRPHLIRFFCNGEERTVGWDFHRPDSQTRALQNRLWNEV